MKLRGDLPKWRASSLDWCANPPGDRRECGRPPTCSVFAPLLESLPWCRSPGS